MPAPIIRRRQLAAAPAQDEEAERSSILRDAASGAMTGLHTIGSALSFPSRVVWGTANALAGGQGGFGNLNPLDSTGGIEFSKFLENQGLIAPNDPNKWEGMDFGRFGLDMLGDPTSYLGFGALTAAGKGAQKAGRLTGTTAQQIGRGDRALLGLQIPFSAKSTGLIGTGPRAASVAQGAANVGNAIMDARIPGTQVSPGRWLTSKFDWRKLGMRTPETQAQAPRFAQDRLNGWRGNAEFLQGIARGWQEAGMDTNQWQRSLGLARETALAFEDETGRMVTHADGPDFWNHLDPTGGLAKIDDYLRETSARRQMKGVSRTGDLRDVVQHEIDPDNILDIVNSAALRADSHITAEGAEELASTLADEWGESNITQGYLPRYMRPDVRKELDRGSVKGHGAMSVESPLSMQRQEMLKGVRGGRTMVDAIVQDSDADELIRRLAAEAEGPEQAALLEQIGDLTAQLDEAEAMGADPDDLAELASELADLQSQQLTRENVLGQVESLLQSKYGDYVVPMFNDPLENGVERSRLRAMGEWMVNHPELRNQGVYGSDVIGDLWRYADNATTSENAFDFVADTIGRHSTPGRAVDRPTVADPKFVKVGSLLAKVGAHVDEAAAYIASRTGNTAAGVIESTVPKHVADDLTNLGEAIRPVKEADLGKNAYQKFLSAWKAGALSWPRRVVRDRLSGLARNFENGWVSGKSFFDAEHLYRGRALRGYERLPTVTEWISEYGLEPTPEGATEAIRRKFGSYMASSPGVFSDLSDTAASGTAGGVDRLLGAMPGALPESFGQAVQRGAGEAISGLNRPFDIPGVKDIPEAKFGPVRVAQQLSNYTDYLNRAEAFLEMVRQGEGDLPSIFNRIDSAQVNYDSRRSAPADKVMRNLFPFWRFLSRQMPYTLAEVSMNPGGRMAQGIKAVDRNNEADPSLPDAALSGTAIPLGASADGTKTFLTGLGLMHENPAELLGQAAAGDLRSLGYGLAGQLNPLIQKPIEGVTGQSMFREGEKLSDLDPTVGRLLSNIGESVGLLPKGSNPVAVPYGSAVDLGLSALPGLGPLATQIRTATDPRRGYVERAVQLGTGARTLRHSEKAQRRVLRRRLEKLAEDEGGSLGSHLYARPGAVERNPRLGEIIALSRSLEREAAAERRPSGKRVLRASAR